MTHKQTKRAHGQRGTWWTEVGGVQYPTLHSNRIDWKARPLHYREGDPDKPVYGSDRWLRHCQKAIEMGVVVVQRDAAPESAQRDGYIGLFKVENATMAGDLFECDLILLERLT